MSRRALVVGAGFAGSVVAECLARNGWDVLVVERRDHVGGNACDRSDRYGVLVHPYGPHLFHTNADRVATYLSRFTEWRHYEHRVLAQVEAMLLPIPINRITLNRLYGLDLDESGAAAFLEQARVDRGAIRTSEDVVLASVGYDLCERFFRTYTRKQWGLDLSELSPGVVARIPTRINDDDRYFSDKFQAIPAAGYTPMFKRMLDHRQIRVELMSKGGTNVSALQPDHIIYTGPIDEYFSYCFGRLPYRSLRFEHQHLPDCERYQPVAVVNYPGVEPFTRITEFKHITGQQHSGTSIVREYPSAEGDPYYPIPRAENEELYQRYRALADRTPGTTFVGRLAQYRYYNMDQVVAAALRAANTILAAERA